MSVNAIFHLPSPPRPRHRRFGSAIIAPFLAVAAMLAGSATAQAEEESRKSAGKDPVISEIDAFIARNPVDKSVNRWRTKLKKPPVLHFDPKKTYTWKLETNVGEIRFRLFPDVAPMHVSSTIYLTRLGFYDKLMFHRVITGFMAQGGDPLGSGRGGPGYRFAGEFDEKAVHDAPGILSMANSGPGTDGSQFFITFRATPALDNRHTVYGKAESQESLETIRKMEALGRPRDPAPPTSPLFIRTATILIE